MDGGEAIMVAEVSAGLGPRRLRVRSGMQGSRSRKARDLGDAGGGEPIEELAVAARRRRVLTTVRMRRAWRLPAMLSQPKHRARQRTTGMSAADLPYGLRPQ